MVHKAASDSVCLRHPVRNGHESPAIGKSAAPGPGHIESRHPMISLEGGRDLNLLLKV